MQLFTIGLYELNEDGTHALDPNGNLIRTYSNDDIVEYSRVWTGFITQEDRGNIDDALNNRLDPMKIHPPFRDVFPKMGLNQQYIGDGYPLCADLPNQHFLKKGAKYILLGSTPLPELQHDNRWDESVVRFVAGTLSALRIALCGTSNLNSCTFPSVVTLSENLECSGDECKVDTIRVVQVQNGMYYEYVPPPCVHQSFVENPRKIKRRNRGSGEGIDSYMCADPRTAVASTACCFDRGRANAYEAYWGELVRASTAADRCAERSSLDGPSTLDLCQSSEKLVIRNCVGNSCGGPYYPFFWFAPEVRCHILAKVDVRNHRIAVVHSIPDEDPSDKRERRLEEEDNPTFFRVQFLSDPDELALNCVTNPQCSIAEDGNCMCHVIVTNERVFEGVPSTAEAVLSALSVGAFSPDIWDTPYTTADEGGILVHHPEGIQEFSMESVFEVEDYYGVKRFRKNVRSVVRIADTDITFRNPVHFVSLAEPTLRDAQYETDAAIDHYLYHKNTAPFLAIRLAQRFGMSNPSPKYIQAIARAFRTGTYTYESSGSALSFGKGSHGDLAATVATILLHPEARNVILDADPVVGSLREPLLKVTGLMRNLEFRSTPEFPFTRIFRDLQSAIGQMVYQSPGIFSFFLPEYQPSGLVASAGLVSPEAQVHSTPMVIQTMNGLLAMIKYGLDSCYRGFGGSRNYGNKRDCKWRKPGEYENASAIPDFTPNDGAPAKIVDELATIMTSGRLNTELREIIAHVISKESDPVQAAIQAQQLIVSTSEFHSTGTARKRGELRTRESTIVPSKKPYKAVVFLMLPGGYDSYNLVVPHTCSATNEMGLTVLEQYASERGEIALKSSERNLVIDVKDQPCQKFAIHDQMPLVQELYKEGDLSLFLNAGVINEPVTKDTYRKDTATRLFAHNTMQSEAQRIDPFSEIVRTGILGRVSQILNSEMYGFHAQGYSINSFAAAVNVDDPYVPPPVVLSEVGPEKLNDKPAREEFDPLRDFKRLNGANHASSSLFAEAWSESFMSALEENEFYDGTLANVSVPHSCNWKSFDMVVQLMETRMERGVDRDLFYVSFGGWDHHSGLKPRLSAAFERLNEALTCYVNNLKDLGLWDKVTLVLISEFGRTLTPNTNAGSDHAWAGHYFAMGGSVKGGQAYGKYPTDITENGPLNVGRGRIIPTLSWESIWMPVCEWMGVAREDCSDFVLPNSERTGSPLLELEDVFEAE